MIKISIFKNGFVVKGHADYAEHGKDIVCSAVSAITQTIMIGLITKCNAVVDVHEGNMSVHIANVSKESDLLLDTMLRGLKEIESEYHKHLKIKENKT